MKDRTAILSGVAVVTMLIALLFSFTHIVGHKCPPGVSFVPGDSGWFLRRDGSRSCAMNGRLVPDYECAILECAEKARIMVPGLVLVGVDECTELGPDEPCAKFARCPAEVADGPYTIISKICLTRAGLPWPPAEG